MVQSNLNSSYYTSVDINCLVFWWYTGMNYQLHTLLDIYCIKKGYLENRWYKVKVLLLIFTTQTVIGPWLGLSNEILCISSDTCGLYRGADEIQ